MPVRLIPAPFLVLMVSLRIENLQMMLQNVIKKKSFRIWLDKNIDCYIIINAGNMVTIQYTQALVIA